MKKIGILIGCLCLASGAFAQDHLHNFQMAYEASYYKYKEPGTMSLRARPKQGVSAVYTRRSVLSGDVNEDDPSFFSIDFRYMTGDVDYDGARQNGTPLQVDNLRDYYFETGLRLGSVYSLSQQWELWPYMGVGWRRLRNHLEESGMGGYMRQSTYWYLPLGFSTRYHQSGWNLVLNGEFDWLLSGTQYSGPVESGDPLVGKLSGNDNKQNDGYGVRVSFKVQRDMGKVGLFVEPFWRYWHIQNSNIGAKELVNYPGLYLDGFYEPKNYTSEYGVKVGLAF